MGKGVVKKKVTTYNQDELNKKNIKGKKINKHYFHYEKPSGAMGLKYKYEEVK